MLANLWESVKETLWEFQAGPGARRTTLKKRKKLPKWKVPKRVPVKKQPVTKQVRLKRRVYAYRRPTEKLEIIRERAVISREEPPEPWEDEKDSGITAEAEKAQERVERVISEPVKKKLRANRRFYEPDIDKKQRHLLFMNPGTDKIQEAMGALASGSVLPAWAQPFSNELRLVKGKLMFGELRMATMEQKREAVKRQYFDPKGPSTIDPITDALRGKWANISKTNVTRILRSLETYQRNFRRRRPPKIMGRMGLKNPGVIAMDMFFPTKHIAGWEGKWSCLTCMDCWSRYTHVYACVDKKFATVEKAMTMFLQEFAGFGFMPRRILCDKGTDMAPAKKVMEPYRRAQDVGAMVFHPKTAQPVNIVEAMNAEVQRHMQVFRTSGLTDDPSVLLEDITYAINRKKRPTRGNLTPIQLLSLTKEERQRVNGMYDDSEDIPEIEGLAKLVVGNSVRVLLWSRKDQAKNTFKGFTAKWSKEVYTVLRKVAIPKNRNNFRYHIGVNKTYYRHELLKVPRIVDTATVDLVSHRQIYVAPEEAWSDEEYNPDSD